MNVEQYMRRYYDVMPMNNGNISAGDIIDALNDFDEDYYFKNNRDELTELFESIPTKAGVDAFMNTLDAEFNMPFLAYDGVQLYGYDYNELYEILEDFIEEED